jgi:O-antigen ligase
MNAPALHSPKPSTSSLLENYIGIWLALGFFELLAGLYIFPSRNAYITVFYLLFLLPSLISMAIHFRSLVIPYFQSGALLFLAFILYLTSTSLWGGPTDLGDNLKRAITIIVASFGLFYLQLRHERYFHRACIAALFTTAGIGLFWLIDSYILNNNPLSLRFLYGRNDYFNLYDKQPYGGFYNPLLFSHTLSFFLTLLAGIFSQGIIKNRFLTVGLTCSGTILFVLLLAAQTRMAWLVVLTVYGTALLIKLGRKGALISVIILTVLALIFFQLDHSVLSRGLSHRPLIWLETLKQMPGSWLFGHGMGSHFEINIPKYRWSDPHNIYLAVLFYSGLLGVLLLIAALYKTITNAHLSEKFSPWFILWLVYVLLSGMADGGGLLPRPKEHWFNLIIPVMFLLAYSRARALKIQAP